MANINSKLKLEITNAARSLTPPFLWKAVVELKDFANSLSSTAVEKKQLLKKNSRLKNIHSGKRIFILGTGPSIREQNLLPLKNEICIGLNEFYLHPDLNVINPEYMIFSGFSLHPDIAQKAVEWYKNYEQNISKNSVLILNSDDKPILEKHNLLAESEKYFMSYSKPYDCLDNYGFCPDKFSYHSQNVAIMGLQLAIYMGASEIYLLGCDHDWILTALENRQNHFYDDKQSVIYKNQVADSKRSIFNDLLRPYYIMFQQYQIIKNYVEKIGQCKIYNASKRTLLDVFEKKNFEDVVH